MYGPLIANKQIATFSEKVHKSKNKFADLRNLFVNRPPLTSDSVQSIRSFRIETNSEGPPLPVLHNFFSVKGSLTRDFRLQVFFMNQCPPGPQVFHWGHFEFFR
jgi:hypothetical protein